MKTNTCLAVALVVALAAMLCGCGRDQPSPTKAVPPSGVEPIKPAALQPLEFLIDWQAEPTYLGIYYARSIGAFRDIGLDVRIVQSWGANEAAAAISAGKYAIGTASGAATVIARSSGAKLVSTAVIYHHLPTVIFGLAETGIHAPHDLNGKTIGIYAKSVTLNEFEAFAKLNGIDQNKVRIESISGPDLPLILAKKVDAVLNYFELSPTQLSMEHKTFQLLLDDYGVKSYGLNIIAGQDAYSKDPTQIKAITRAVLKGYELGCLNADDATGAFLKEFPEKDPKYVKLSWEMVCKFINRDYGSQTNAGWQQTIGLYSKLGLLNGAVTPQDILPKDRL
jgi:NitT/TauT family transport system substrate-binding protein